MDPIVTSSLISAGSKILGGALGGRSKRGPSFEDQLIMRSRALDKDVASKIRVGQKFGIHPLTMLGVQSPYQLTGSASTSGGSRMDNLGEAIASAGTDLSRSVKAPMSNAEKLQERLLLAQIEGQEIDNVSRASMLRRANQPGDPPAGTGLNERLSKVTPGLGAATGAMPLHRVAFDEEGSPVILYNDDLGDNEMAQAAHFFRYTAPSYIHERFTKPAGKKLRSFLSRASDFYSGSFYERR